MEEPRARVSWNGATEDWTMDCRFDGTRDGGHSFTMSETEPHVLFVCTGNTCRSPMAEGLFRVAGGEDGFMVSSAGIAAYGGGGASLETLEILAGRGIDLDGFGSRVVDDTIIERSSHVFCMTRDHLDTLETRYPEQRDKFHLACDFADIEGEVGRDVPDPIGGGRRAYEEVAACLDLAIKGILGFLRTEEGPPAE